MKNMDEIVARAEPLWERLRRSPAPDYDPELGAVRLETWTRVVAGGDPVLFERRLTWAGLHKEGVQQVLGSLEVRPDGHPSWATTLVAISEAARSVVRLQALGGTSLPFEPLFLPMLLVAHDRLYSSPFATLLSEDARHSLQKQLLLRLAEVAARVLYAEFARALPGGPDLVSVLIGPPPAPSTKHYDAFVRDHLQDGYETLFRRYPVLARLMATILDDWVAATAEFVCRFEAARRHLEFASIARLHTGLSEPHNHGRGVFVLEGETGKRLVYKARSVDGEAAFHRVCAWCNEQSPPGWLPLRAPAVQSHHDHGWIEYVATEACRNPGEVDRYYERIGEILCVLHALQSTDVNQENLLASGEDPVLIDTETLLQSDARPMNSSVSSASLSTYLQEYGRSVARPSLLPVWVANPTGATAFNIAGLAGSEPEQTFARSPHFYHVNTDSMVLVNDFGEMPPSMNMVRLNGRALDPADYAPPILAGFERTYRFLSKRHNEFVDAVARPAGGFPPIRLRYVFRATRLYHAILLEALPPEYLTDGIEHSIQLDRISRPFLEAADRPGGFPIVEAELEALERGEIPYFGIGLESRDLDAGRQRIADFCEETPLQRAKRMFRGFHEPGLRAQNVIIRGTLEAHRAHVFVEGPEPLPDPSHLAPVTRGELLSAANAIAGEIRRSAIWVRPGGHRPEAFWMGAVRLENCDRYNFVPLGESLYGGRCGIALFLAALACMTGSREDEPLIEAALRYPESAWKDDSVAMGAPRIIAAENGAGFGMASIAYALFRIGHFLRRGDFMQSAVACAATLGLDAPRHPMRSDLLSGHAGVILVLLRLFQETGDPGLLSIALRRAACLLRHRDRAGDGTRAWSFPGIMPAGMAHGAAGIAYAFLRLFEITSDERYLRAAGEGMEYEDSLFDPETGNWRDLRQGKEGSHLHRPSMAGWCHGASGIGLARLAGLDIWDDPARRADVEAAITTTLEQPLDDEDHLCCGNAGRLEFLWTAALHLKRQALRDRTLRQAKWMLARADTNQGFRHAQGKMDLSISPSLFRGAAGIGYELLRLLDPASMPSLLLIG
jgi:type 2 lantibiotic biosynthesis protein LanM